MDPEVTVQDKHVSKVSSRKRHVWPLAASLSMALGSAGLGTVLGYSSPAIPDINNYRGSPFHLGTADASWLASGAALGLLVGGLAGGYLLDRYGRKTSVMFAALLSVIGWTLICASPNIACMHIGRVLTGLSGGLINVAVPIYTIEVSEPSVRGFMGSIHQIFFNVGILYVNAFALVVHWRWLAIACACLPSAMVLALLAMPESPRWLIAHGHHAEGVAVLRWLRADVDVSEEVAAIDKSMKENATQDFHVLDFATPTVYKPLVIVVGLMFLQQLSGYAAFTSYTVSILASAGSSLDPNVLATVVGLVGVLANGTSAVVVDHAGRRLMLFVSACSMFVCCCGIGTFFVVRYNTAHFDTDRFGLVPILLINLFVFGVCLGYGSIPFYLASELFPLKARGLAGGVGVAAVSLSTFLMSFSFQFLREGVGDQGVYWILAGVCALAAVFVLFVPETKGKSLEDIEKMFI